MPIISDFEDLNLCFASNYSESRQSSSPIQDRGYNNYNNPFGNDSGPSKFVITIIVVVILIIIGVVIYKAIF
jgi:hypothetical protein